ncbi:GLPGLI family protein [Chryseobacterium cucumeris]|uniref:GLPGLI family protein n=2 Tax=Chryseobacterium group TaxID=2782232 RepID=A0ABX9X437_9FLAO|nr:GLPGLI family protein [Chryseobacterium cucumeris]KYH05721.1 hypothetical protein A1704_11555 [Chryseobacterium cucumeris]ROH90552.1 GLPGLI family protein [Chryseobacterium cucumeris]
MINKSILSKVVSIIFLLGSFSIYFGQNYQIIYEVRFKPLKQSDSFAKEYMALKIINGQSIFYNLNKEKIDSLVKENNFKDVAFVTSSFLRFKIFKDLSKNHYIIGGNFNQFNYWYKENNIKYYNIKKFGKYNDYISYEAFANFGKREWKLLYTHDIPINDGPYVFSGLPGLVIKAESLDKDYCFELIEIKKLNEQSEITNNKENIRKEKLVKDINDFMNDPAAHHINFKNDLGDSFNYEFKGIKDKNYEATNEYLQKIINQFNNYPDKDVPIITF